MLKVPRAVEPFSLREVRLLDGPFRDAMLRDQKYLLSLEPDRFLFNFQKNMGLETTVRPYGGWDAPDSEQRGAMLGHYLSVCSQMYASLGDAAGLAYPTALPVPQRRAIRACRAQTARNFELLFSVPGMPPAPHRPGDGLDRTQPLGIEL